MIASTSPLQLSDERIISAVSGVDWNFTEAHTGGFTHGFHPYPAKFIPQISDTLIDFFTLPGDTVADVFCGSGTTLVEAVRAGRNAIGIDANPLATLIARVKGRPLDQAERTAVADCARHAADLIGLFYQDISPAQVPQLDLFEARPLLPPIRDLDFWFPQEAQNELALIKQAMDACPLVRAREFLQVAFSSIIVNVSYQDSDTRYTRRDKGLKAKETLRKWQARVHEMLATIQQFDALAPLGVIRTLAMDARCLEGVEANSVDLVVTSPPYPNAYSYHLYHRFRMEWLGYDQPRFKQEEIGSHRKYSAKGDKGATAQTFRAEMTDVLRSVEQMLKPGKLCVFVIGNSIIRGEKIDNAVIIREAGQSIGLRPLVTLNRAILSGRKAFNPAIGNIKQEHLVFFAQAMIAYTFFLQTEYQLRDFERALGLREVAACLQKANVPPDVTLNISPKLYEAIGQYGDLGAVFPYTLQIVEEIPPAQICVLTPVRISKTLVRELAYVERIEGIATELPSTIIPTQVYINRLPKMAQSTRETALPGVETLETVRCNKREHSYLSHSFHAYKGKYYPQLVGALLNMCDVQPGDWVLEPFAGSGTTLVECAMRSVNVAGIDMNPLARLIAEVKTNAVKEPFSLIEANCRHILATLRNSVTTCRGQEAGLDQFLPENRAYLREWFLPEALAEINACLRAIRKYRYAPSQGICLLALSDSLREISLQDPESLRVLRRKTPHPHLTCWNA